MKRSVFSTLPILVLALVLAGCGSCKKEPQPDRSAPSQRSQADAGPAPDAAMAELREAYGIPFPPEIVDIDRYPTFVLVTTRLNLDEVESFYKARLVDFEILRPDPNQVVALGLRDYMPYLRAMYLAGPHTPVQIRYYPARARAVAAPTPQVEDATEEPSDDVARGRTPRHASRRPAPKREKGSAVTLRTPSGELLAPGARWGEPYTPPPGSPLDKPAFRSNFGKPFGEWGAH